MLSGNSHPTLVDNICGILGVPPGNRTLTKFSVGETRCEIQDSVRGKDVYIIQSGGGGSVNDHFVELCISKKTSHLILGPRQDDTDLGLVNSDIRLQDRLREASYGYPPHIPILSPA